MLKIFKKLSTGQLIALGFASVILIGSGLLMLPFCINEGQEIQYIDALYTSTSAVCVTGLIAIDPGTAFTPIGRSILAMLIQVGGLGVTMVGAGIILAMGKRIGLKGRNLIQDASNLDNGKGTVRFVRQVLVTTLIIEAIGALASFAVFIHDYDLATAVGYSIFHSIAAFNNSGFDILGHSGELYSNENLFAYHGNIPLNLITSILIILGGIGFLVIREIMKNGFHFKRYSMHAKVVLSMTAFLIVAGTLLIKLTESSESWLGAYFHSVSARTAGFSTTNMADYSDSGLFTMIVLMFIGASPGSTGGGIKTTTVFVLICGIISAATNRSDKAFKYAIPKELFRKSAVIMMLALCVVITATWFLMVMDPNVPFMDALFEMTSAFGTVGLSTGITSSLSMGSKILSIIIMYIGRLGPLTVASLWNFSKGERYKYPEGNISIG